MPGQIHCKSCGTPYDASARICVRCGIDLRTGKPLRTSIGAPVPDADDEDDGPVTYTAWEKFQMAVGAFVPGLFRPMLLIVSLLVVCVAMVGGWFCLVLLGFGTLFPAVAVGAVALIVYAQAVAWILIGRFELLHDALAEFDGRAWTLFAIIVWGPFFVVLALAKMATSA